MRGDECGASAIEVEEIFVGSNSGEPYTGEPYTKDGKTRVLDPNEVIVNIIGTP